MNEQQMKQFSVTWIEAKQRLILNTKIEMIEKFGKGDDALVEAYSHYFKTVDNARKAAE